MDKPQIGIPDHLDFGINLMSMHSWLSEQKSSNYLEEIEELKHTLSIVSTILSLQQKRAYVSIKEVFDITLTPSEFKEYQEFADRANSSDVSDAPEISERILFLAIVQQDYLSRSQGERYARLWFLEGDGNLTQQENEELQNYKSKIAEIDSIREKELRLFNSVFRGELAARTISNNVISKIQNI